MGAFEYREQCRWVILYCELLMESERVYEFDRRTLSHWEPDCGGGKISFEEAGLILSRFEEYLNSYNAKLRMVSFSH